MTGIEKGAKQYKGQLSGDESSNHIRLKKYKIKFSHYIMELRDGIKRGFAPPQL